MARIVTTHNRYKRPSSDTPKTAASRAWLVAIVAADTLLAGCMADSRPSDQYLAVHGYWYHDANHPNEGSGQASPQAIYNATHGVWLWPPNQVRDSPDG
jgi:hypothetical protein